MQTKKLNATLSLWAVLVGSIFLISPMFAVVDVLPDFVGYAFILFGVSKFADMNDKIAEAAKYFRRLVILGIVRMVAILFVYGMASPVERPTLQLLCSFVLCVLDCMALIPGWKQLSGGLLYLATRHEGQAIFDVSYKNKPTKNTKTLLERTTKATIVFLVLREVLSVLPEFAVLTAEEGGAEVATRTSLYEFIGFMREVCGAVVLIWGIVWLIGFLRFGLHLGKDKVFFDGMRAKYQTEVLTKPDLFARRGVKRAMVFMCIGLVFSVDFFLADLATFPLCVTPDFLMGALLLVGLLLVRKYVKSGWWTAAMVATAIYIPLTVAEFILQIFYINMTDIRWAYRDALFYERWTHMLGVRVAVSVASVAVILLLLRLLGDVIERYTGFSVTTHDSAQPAQRVKELHKELKSKLWVVFGMGVATAVSSVIYLATLPLSADTLWELWNFVDVVIPMIFVVVFVHATMQIFEQIDYKYMLS